MGIPCQHDCRFEPYLCVDLVSHCQAENSMRLGWIITTLALCLISFILGLFGGMYVERINYEIDICADQTSGRYIRDETSRREVCGQDTR